MKMELRKGFIPNILRRMTLHSMRLLSTVDTRLEVVLAALLLSTLIISGGTLLGPLPLGTWR